MEGHYFGHLLHSEAKDQFYIVMDNLMIYMYKNIPKNIWLVYVLIQIKTHTHTKGNNNEKNTKTTHTHTRTHYTCTHTQTYKHNTKTNNNYNNIHKHIWPSFTNIHISW